MSFIAFFEEIVRGAIAALGEEIALFLLVLAVGSLGFWILRGIKQIAEYAAPRVVGYVGDGIERKTKATYAGRSFAGFTKSAWRVGIVCAFIAYALIWCFKHFPALWVVWGSLFLATVVVLSIIGYSKSGVKMDPLRFFGFYAPTTSVVVQGLPDIIEKAWPLIAWS